jgi:subtilisin family serine protease
MPLPGPPAATPAGVRRDRRDVSRVLARGVVALLVLTVLGPPTAVSADEVPVPRGAVAGRIPTVLERSGAAVDPDDVYLVVLRPPSALEQLGSLVRRGRTVDLGVRATAAVEAVAGTPRRDLTRLMGAVSAELDADALARLTADPRVLAVIPNVPVRAMDRRVASRQLLPLTGDFVPEYLWNLDRIDRAAVVGDREYRHTTTGVGVDVYVLDTGIRFLHTDFLDVAGQSRILPASAFPGSTFPGGYYDATYYYNVTGTVFASPGYRVAQDCQLHGAHVAGTALGRSSGIAKGAAVIPVKVFPGCALGTDFIEDILDGMQWVLDNRRAGVPAVVNMSLGAGPITPGASLFLDAAVDALVDAGITVVAAAGNADDDACRYWPARVASAITVGSTASGDVRSGFSNHGACVDVFAPGSDIDSSCATILVEDDAVFLTDEGHFVYSCPASSTVRIGGTSMATPLVAGLAARHLEAAPGASPAQVRSAIVGGALSGTEASPLVGDRKAGSPDLLANALFLEPDGPSSTDPAPVPVVLACAGAESSSRLAQLPRAGVGPLTWSITSGSLPGTLALSSAGRLSGSGWSLGDTVTVAVVDAFGRTASWTVPRASLPAGCPVG